MTSLRGVPTEKSTRWSIKELSGKRETCQKGTSVSSWRNRSLRWARFARRGRRSSFCAALPGERVVRSGGRNVLVLPCRSDAVRQLHEYLHRSSGHLTDWYQGETTNTAFVESTINQVVSKRFVKQQQQKSAEEV